MNIIKTLDQYNNHDIFFCEPIKNNIINEGVFIKILYSTDFFVLNGIYLLINLYNITCEKYYTKYKCHFDISTHKQLINKIKNIEENILQKIKINKIPLYKINEQLQNGNFKIFNDVKFTDSTSFILKISGVWETQNNYGLTYKFIKID
jgi:hypothetical protein